jgi:hypothetical protein
LNGERCKKQQAVHRLKKSLQLPFLYVASFSFLPAKKGLPNPKLFSIELQSTLVPSNLKARLFCRVKDTTTDVSFDSFPMWILSYK